MNSDEIRDGRLIRSIDGEPDAALAEPIDDATAARLTQLQHRSARLNALLQSLDAPESRVRASADAIHPRLRDGRAASSAWPGPAPRVAAAIALLLATALLVPPVRAWMARLVAADAADQRTGAPPPEAAPAIVEPAMTISFAAARDTFELWLEQTACTLVLQTTTDALGSATVAGAEGTSFLVLPAGLRVEGPASSDAVYTITLPARVNAVRVSGAAGATVHSLAGSRGPVRIALGPR